MLFCVFARILVRGKEVKRNALPLGGRSGTECFKIYPWVNEDGYSSYIGRKCCFAFLFVYLFWL